MIRIYTAPNISALHGFTTRQGGFSPEPFDSLNLGGSLDTTENISRNRDKLLKHLGLSGHKLSVLKQVHGTFVTEACNGITEADAQVTREKGIVLVVQAADCYPILFHDPVNEVIGAAHAGWRGTVGKICGETIDKMVYAGADRKEIRVAIGPGISKEKFEVGTEVIEAFIESGFPKFIIRGNHIDLASANRYVLEQARVSSENIYSVNRCTFDPEFFSHRRDQGQTGRLWGLISL